MKYKKLCECEKDKEYLIYDIQIKDKDILRRLENLFIKTNEKIIVKYKSYGSKAFIIKALGINYAIDKKICESIIVYDI